MLAMGITAFLLELEQRSNFDLASRYSCLNPTDFLLFVAFSWLPFSSLAPLATPCDSLGAEYGFYDAWCTYVTLGQLALPLLIEPIR